MSKRKYRNRLNDLDNVTWLKFQKSWFIHNPPRRKKDVLQHPAKYPESLAMEFIEFFTKKGQVVFDPMVGTGSTLVAALRTGRHAYGIELNPGYVLIARNMISEERQLLLETEQDLVCDVIQGDASNIPQIIERNQIPPIDYVITSPPYWDMLHAKGAENQEERRDDEALDVVYSDMENDLGNIHDYDQFIEKLGGIYKGFKPYLKPGAYLTVIVKNVKKGGKNYPLAWDLGKSLGELYALKDERIWCQDNQSLFPYGMGSAWVSNTFHHYCLQFRND